jgi:2-polyprenyl-3-methyl-5-hydroxy-6-metoxy-1,4-benzoquinol methylase
VDLGSEDLEELVFSENIKVHKAESQFYDKIHHEIFNPFERRRLTNEIQQLLPNGRGKLAMDFGCGTGNLTSILLKQGFDVVAADISPDMLSVLKEKFPSRIANGTLKTLKLARGQTRIVWPTKFSAILMYSVLHHIYNVEGVLSGLCANLAPGGTMVIEHEVGDGYWRLQKSLIYKMYVMSCTVLNLIDDRMHSIPRLFIDYRYSDYHMRPETRVNPTQVARILKSNGLEVTIKGYFLRRTEIPNPLDFMLAPFFSDMACIIGRKQSQPAALTD